jgi:hypothetical protein
MPGRAAVLVIALIVDRPMCVDCIALKSGVAGTAEVESTLATIRESLQIHEAYERCRACGETKRVLSLNRPG